MLVSPKYAEIDLYLNTHHPCKRYPRERANLAAIARAGRIYSRIHAAVRTPVLVRTHTPVPRRPFNAPRLIIAKGNE